MSSRDRLMDAMSELLWERGYAATSPRDVLTRARVGQGSMYHYFSGKHELAVEAFKGSVETLLSESTLLNGEGTPLDRMKSYLTRPRLGSQGCKVGRMTQDPEVIQDAELIAIVADAFTSVVSQWETVISEAITVGELPSSIDPRALAHTLSATIQGGYVLSRAQGAQEPMDTAICGVIQLLDAAAASSATSNATPSSHEDSTHHEGESQ